MPDDDPFARIGRDRERRIRTASPSISEIEHRESYDAIRKRNLLDSVKDQEDIERADNPDFLDEYGEALKQTAMHPLETAKAIPRAIIGAATDIIAPSREAAASLNQPNSQPRRQLAARFGPSYLTDPEPFGKGVTGEQRALGVAQTAATVLAPGASLGRVLGFGALAGAASSPDNLLLGAAMGTTLGGAARVFRAKPKAPAYEPPARPAPSTASAPFQERVAAYKAEQKLKARERMGIPPEAVVTRRPKAPDAPNPFDDLAIKEAETPPVPITPEPVPVAGTPAAESQPFAMGGPESRIPKAPPQPRGPRTEPPVWRDAADETAHAGAGVVSPEASRAAEYPAGTPRAMDPKTLANAVKRTGLTDESAEAARKQILDSGYQPVRVTFAEQAKVAEQLAGTLGVEVKALRPDLARRMSIPEMYAKITKASTNVKLIEALSKEVTEGTLTPDEALNLTHALEKLESENHGIYGDVLVAGSQKGRELGAMRMIARLSTDPAVWEVQAMRKLGGKPLSDAVRGTIRRMAKEVAEACAL